jgi:hypothetical protein
MKDFLSNFTLSLASGYSQSMSNPLNPYLSKNSKQLAIRFALSSADAAIGDKIAFPAFQPPMLNMVFKYGFISFRASTPAMFPKSFHLQHS